MPGYDIRKQMCTVDDIVPQMSTPDRLPYQQQHGNAYAQQQLASYTPLEESVEEDTGPRSGIEICSRIAELPVAEQLGLRHRWIRTPNLERGMGPADGGVPGVDGDRGDKPFSPTMVTDHAGQGVNPKSTCVPAAEWNPDWADVDQECVERQSALNTPTGRWTPLLNDCHDWVNNTMNDCDPTHESTTEMIDRLQEPELEMIRNREIPYVGSSFKPMP
jgi:hypothetical protein